MVHLSFYKIIEQDSRIVCTGSGEGGEHQSFLNERFGVSILTLLHCRYRDPFLSPPHSLSLSFSPFPAIPVSPPSWLPAFRASFHRLVSRLSRTHRWILVLAWMATLKRPVSVSFSRRGRKARRKEEAKSCRR